MKKTQLLDARRNIRKELVAFLSIVVIGLLASVAYLGITYSAAALKKDAVNFFNSQELWDTEAVSTMLMTEEDLEAIRSVPGVREAEPVWLVDTSLHTGQPAYRRQQHRRLGCQRAGAHCTACDAGGSAARNGRRMRH